MRGRFRRRATPIVDLDVTAFINLMVVLVAFFLSSVAYYQFSSLELNIPPAAAGGANPDVEALQLEVIIRKNALEVSDRGTGLIRRFENPSSDTYDFPGLTALLRQIKARYPNKTDSSILAEADIPYDVLVKTMDAVRSYPIRSANKIVYTELFPDLSIGDAPATEVTGEQP